MNSQWSFELWRLGLSLFAALFIGWVIDYVLLSICIVLAFYLFLHMRALYRFDSRLRHSKSYNSPDISGVWGEVYYLFDRAQRRQRSRKKLLVSYLNRFQMMTKAMPDATVVLRNGSEIEWFNEAAQRQLGLRQPQDLLQRIDNLIRIPQFIELLRLQNNHAPLEIPSPVNDENVLSLIVIPYGKDRSLLVARDVTQLHRLEETRRDFVANVSHELRTPLTVLNGYLETMADLPDDDTLSKVWGYPVKVMYEQSRRMNTIVEDLLMLSRLETGRRATYHEAIDMPSMVKIIAEEGRLLSAEKAHNITTEIDEALWYCGNQTQLFSLLSNLVFNAVHYTPEGGNIVLRWYVTDKTACFEVQDSGVGIAPQHISRLTERFYRVDEGRSRDKGGTGLGLAIVKHIAEHHDGCLSIESTLGKGSTFRCSLPKNATSEAQPT